MTTNVMTCEDFSDRLMAYLEHETDDATRAALERHALSCAECGALLADLRRLRIEASNLPELTPSRDLWSGIAARIEAPVVPIGVHQPALQPSVAARGWTRRALVAASLVAAAGVGYFAADARRATDFTAMIPPPSVSDVPGTLPAAVVEGVAPDPASRTQSPAQRVAIATPRAAPTTPIVQTVAADRAYITLVADYDREIAKLRVLIEQRRNQLDPVTVAIIEKNLQVIDSAIAECKKAIARDPASRFLIESLNQSLQTKVELMRTAALLPTRT